MQIVLLRVISRIVIRAYLHISLKDWFSPDISACHTRSWQTDNSLGAINKMMSSSRTLEACLLCYDGVSVEQPSPWNMQSGLSTGFSKGCKDLLVLQALRRLCIMCLKYGNWNLVICAWMRNDLLYNPFLSVRFVDSCISRNFLQHKSSKTMLFLSCLFPSNFFFHRVSWRKKNPLPI